jgi:Flp pilus assembly protein TadG
LHYMRKNRTGERGATMAEFAIIAAVFFMIIFGIIEFGRLFYTHNALTDAARRGARYAVMHEKADLTCVKRVVVYGETHVDPVTCVENGPPLINGLTTTQVNVTYAADFGTNVGTVTVEITNYTFNLSIPFARQTLTMPRYVTTLTAESAGRIPDPIITP